jgi:hypothetical protein
LMFGSGSGMRRVPAARRRFKGQSWDHSLIIAVDKVASTTTVGWQRHELTVDWEVPAFKE